MKRIIIEIGFKQGRLTVHNNNYGKDKFGRYQIVCGCDCGKTIVVDRSSFRSNHTQSCGCLQKEKVSAAATKRPDNKRGRKGPAWMHTAKEVWRSNNYKNDGCSFETFFKLSQRPCFYCDKLPSNRVTKVSKSCSDDWREQGYWSYNGLDRIDSNKNHCEDNIVSCCWTCNTAKMAMSQAEFFEWIRAVHNNLLSKHLVET